MRLLAVTIPHAVLATIKPPAIFSTGSEMPKKFSTKRPKNRNMIRMAITFNEVFRAVRLRSAGAKLEVKEKKKGTPPKGLTMGNSARKVAVAAEGRSRKRLLGVIGMFRERLKIIRDGAESGVETAWRARCQARVFRSSSTRTLPFYLSNKPETGTSQLGPRPHQ